MEVSRYGVFPGPYFPISELNMEFTELEQNSVFGQFSRSEYDNYKQIANLKTGVRRKQSTPNFPKKDYFYAHTFLASLFCPITDENVTKMLL